MTTGAGGGLGQYLRSKDFRYTVVAILIFFGISLLVGFLWLKIYTHHSQGIENAGLYRYSL
jgi:hypothetical protein